MEWLVKKKSTCCWMQNCSKACSSGGIHIEEINIINVEYQQQWFGKVVFLMSSLAMLEYCMGENYMDANKNNPINLYQSNPGSSQNSE